MYRPNQDIEDDLGVVDDAWKLVVPSEERKKYFWNATTTPLLDSSEEKKPSRE